MQRAQSSRLPATHWKSRSLKRLRQSETSCLKSWFLAVFATVKGLPSPGRGNAEPNIDQFTVYFSHDCKKVFHMCSRHACCGWSKHLVLGHWLLGPCSWKYISDRCLRGRQRLLKSKRCGEHSAYLEHLVHRSTSALGVWGWGTLLSMSSDCRLAIWFQDLIFFVSARDTQVPAQLLEQPDAQAFRWHTARNLEEEQK